MNSKHYQCGDTPDYEFLHRSAKQGIICFNPEGMIISANPAAEEILGIEADRLTGKTTEDPDVCFTEEDGLCLQGLSHPVTEAMHNCRTVGPFDVKIFNRKQQKERWLSLTALPQCSSGASDPCLVYLIISDKTETKLAELRVRHIDQGKEMVFSSISEKVIYHDSDMRVIWTNRAAGEDIIGNNRAQIGVHCRELFNRHMMDCHDCPAKKALISGRYEEDILNFTDDTTHHIRAHPLEDDKGAVVGVVQINQDITDRIKTEVDLMRAKEEAEAASKAKSRFLANMSHEIRTPMNIIIGMTDLLYRSELNNEQKEYVGMVKDSANALLAILNDILDFSKLEADRLELSFARFNLREEIEKTVSSFRHQAHQKGIALDVAIAPDLPQLLIGDILRVKQVLTNLLSNAIKFTERGYVKLAVEPSELRSNAGLSSSAHDTNEEIYNIRFAVEDSGIGIPEDKQDQLFKSFTQIGNAGPSTYDGTGLGLVISKNLVEIMGGRIRFESKPGRGSTFSFYLPFKITSAHHTSVDYKEDQPYEGYGFKESLSLLLVEDKPMNRKMATTLLQKMGHSVDIAANGREAVEMIKANNYDAVLMDINMPEMDGLEATRIIRERERAEGLKRLPIIAMTAYAMKGDREGYLAAGMDQYVSKPIKPSILYTALDKAVSAGEANKKKKLTASAASPGQDELGFDPEQVLSRFNGNETLLQELIELFLEDYHQEIVEADKALIERNRDKLKSIIHGLKGEVGNLGLDSAYRLATEIDRILKDQLDPGIVKPLLEQFKAEILALEAYYSHQDRPRL